MRRLISATALVLLVASCTAGQAETNTSTTSSGTTDVTTTTTTTSDPPRTTTTATTTTTTTTLGSTPYGVPEEPAPAAPAPSPGIAEGFGGVGVVTISAGGVPLYEDRSGEPFVGRAGRLLNKIFAAAEIRREDVYITNIVKCRPPGNRAPRTIEWLAPNFSWVSEGDVVARFDVSGAEREADAAGAEAAL